MSQEPEENPDGKPRRRGRPSSPSYNVRLVPEDAVRIGEGFPGMQHDGRGLDFRVGAPPWSEAQIEEIFGNLARLRTDPTSTSHIAAGNRSITMILCWQCEELAPYTSADSDWQCISMAEYMSKLLSRWPSNTIEEAFKDIAKLARNRDDLPHPNFWALKAYYDFVAQFGFDPSSAKLRKFVMANSLYKVGSRIGASSDSKEWWDLLFAAGLSRL